MSVFVLSFDSTLYILDVSFLSDICYKNISPQSVAFLSVSFKGAGFLNVDWIQFVICFPLNDTLFNDFYSQFPFHLFYLFIKFLPLQ